MVNAFIGSNENGIYAVSYKIPTILTLVSTVFMQAWQFSAVVESHGDKREHVRFFTGVWRSFQAVMFLAGGVIIALSKPAIKLLSTEDYYSAWQYVPLLAASMIFTAFVSFTGTVYVVTKNSGVSFLTSTASAVINIVLNFILIPSPLGVQGAAIATFISYFAVFLIRAVNIKKYIPFKMYGGHVTVNTLLIMVQTVFMVLELPFWIAVQALCLLLLIAVNFKFILACIYKLLSVIKK